MKRRKRESINQVVGGGVGPRTWQLFQEGCGYEIEEKPLIRQDIIFVHSLISHCFTRVSVCGYKIVR